MDLGKASRFSVLEDDYEGRHPNANSSTTRASRSSNKNMNLPGESNEKKIKQIRKNDKASNRGIDTDLQNLAFCPRRQKKLNGSQQQPAKSTKNLPSVFMDPNQELSEQKKRADEEEQERLRFESDLEQALLLSKLDYDKTKMYQKNFKELPPTCGRTTKPSGETCQGKCIQVIADLSDQVAILQIKDEEKTLKNVELMEKLAESFETTELVKEELNKLKSLSSTEIYENLEKQIEEQLRENKELSEEVTRLHVALEQERSKNHILHMELLHMQNSRKDAK